MVKICDDCGTENSNGATRCVGCGNTFFRDKLRRLEQDMLDRM